MYLTPAAQQQGFIHHIICMKDCFITTKLLIDTLRHKEWVAFDKQSRLFLEYIGSIGLGTLTEKQWSGNARLPTVYFQ